MTTTQWRKRYVSLRNAQTKLWAHIVKVAPLVYTKYCLNKVILKDDFYESFMTDLDQCVKESFNNYAKKRGLK